MCKTSEIPFQLSKWCFFSLFMSNFPLCRSKPNFGCFCLTTHWSNTSGSSSNRLATFQCIAVVSTFPTESKIHTTHKYARFCKAVYDDGKQNHGAKNQKQDKLLLQRVTERFGCNANEYLCLCIPTDSIYFLVSASSTMWLRRDVHLCISISCFQKKFLRWSDVIWVKGICA